jgi:L-lactate dehydrogenase complex protein LldG
VSARDDVLARIAAAQQAASPPELPYESIERTYRSGSDHDHQQVVERLVDRLIDYKALVRRCPVAGVPTDVARAVADRGLRSVAVPDDLDQEWLVRLDDVVIRPDNADDSRLSATDLDKIDGVITACAVAVAETGTLILDGSAGTGRRILTLIPDYHLCVVLPHQVVADVPQAIARLEPTRPLTMISGPSATSDIELNRVEGVHGPRTLEVIIVEPPAGAARFPT